MHKHIYLHIYYIYAHIHTHPYMYTHIYILMNQCLLITCASMSPLSEGGGGEDSKVHDDASCIRFHVYIYQYINIHICVYTYIYIRM